MTQPPEQPQHPWQRPWPQRPPADQGWVPQEAPPPHRVAQERPAQRPWTPQDPQQQWVPQPQNPTDQQRTTPAAPHWTAPAPQQTWPAQEPQPQWPQQPPWAAPEHAPGPQQRAREFEPVPIPPRKKSRAGLVVVLALAAVTLLTGGVVAAVSTSSDEEATTRPIGGSGSVATSATEPAETSTSEPTASTTTSTSEIEDPDARPVVALGNNPINITGNGAANTECTVPDFNIEISAQDRFYQATIDCLMQAWAHALHEANLPVETPRVITVGEDTNTPCGVRRWNQTALYCPNDHTIYMTARYYAEVENRTRGGVYLGQFTHEFGHAIQGLAGINTAYGDALGRAGSTSPAGLELTRRSELQATCFEGMSLAALQNGGVSNELIFPALQDSSLRGDEHGTVPDHGSTQTNAAWVNQGFTKNRVVQCNTWLSAPQDVD